MHVTLAGAKLYCHNCKRTTWHHYRLNNKVVCRGDVPPSVWVAKNGTPPGYEPGCGRER